MNYKKLIETICYAVLNTINQKKAIDNCDSKLKTKCCLKTKCKKECDLPLIVKWLKTFNGKKQKFLGKRKLNTIKIFQEGILHYLNSNNSSHAWEKECKASGRKELDSIDIKGNPKSNNDLTCIIEIDACRQDQVAEKFLSRLALWGIKKPIIYVALIYSKPNSSKNMVKKYIRFATDIISVVNELSIVVGLYIDVHNNPNIVEVWDYNNKKSSLFKTTFEITDSKGKKVSCDSMSKCASEAIKLYVSKNPHMTYDDIKKNVFGRYVNHERGPSRYKKTYATALDKNSKKIDIYSYTQFRHYGEQAYWDDFVDRCKKQGVEIKEIVPHVP